MSAASAWLILLTSWLSERLDDDPARSPITCPAGNHLAVSAWGQAINQPVISHHLLHCAYNKEINKKKKMPTDKTLGTGDSIAWNNKVSCNSAVVNHRKAPAVFCYWPLSVGSKVIEKKSARHVFARCLPSINLFSSHCLSSKKRRNEGKVITLIFHPYLHSANIYSVFDLTFHSVSSSHVFTL